jgi:hypothetical protein
MTRSAIVAFSVLLDLGFGLACCFGFCLTRLESQLGGTSTRERLAHLFRTDTTLLPLRRFPFAPMSFILQIVAFIRELR